MPLSQSEQDTQALELLPVEGEVEFDAYKDQLYAANPDNGKIVFGRLLKQNAMKKRLDTSTRPVTVYLSRKVG